MPVCDKVGSASCGFGVWEEKLTGDGFVHGYQLLYLSTYVLSGASDMAAEMHTAKRKWPDYTQVADDEGRKREIPHSAVCLAAMVGS